MLEEEEEEEDDCLFLVDDDDDIEDEVDGGRGSGQTVMVSECAMPVGSTSKPVDVLSFILVSVFVTVIFVPCLSICLVCVAMSE